MVAEDEVKVEEVDSTYPTKGTQNFSYKKEAIEEPSQEGRASTLARAVKTQPNADIVESSPSRRRVLKEEA